MNRIDKNKFPIHDQKVMAHLFGLGLDCTDGHKRITQADKFSIMGGLPASETNYSISGFKKMLDAYKSVQHSDLRENLRDIPDRQQKLEDRVAKLTQRYAMQYSNMEGAVAGLKDTGDMISQMLEKND